MPGIRSDGSRLLCKSLFSTWALDVLPPARDIKLETSGLEEVLSSCRIVSSWLVR